MPQLTPDPWLSIFIFAWTTLIFIIPKKILNHKILNDPTPKTSYINQSTWPWPWT